MRKITIQSTHSHVCADELGMKQRIVQVDVTILAIDKVNRINWVKITLTPIDAANVPFSAQNEAGPDTSALLCVPTTPLEP